MDFELGIDVARDLRKVPYNGSIVFLTVSPDYALESYDVDADGYILKPLSYEKVCNVMNKLTVGHAVEVFQDTFRNHVISIPYHEILYFESSNSKCFLHRNNGKAYPIYKKLSEIQEALAKDPRWLRCHQSYLVNMTYIQYVDNRFILFNGDVVLIRQRKLKEIREHYLSFVAQMQKQ